MSIARNKYCYFSVYQPPSFTLTPEPVQISLGKVVSLACKAEGWPVPEIMWYFGDGLLLLDDQHVAVEQQVEGALCASTLSLKNVRPARHAGKYTMEATNRCGNVKQTVVVSGERHNVS